MSQRANRVIVAAALAAVMLPATAWAQVGKHDGLLDPSRATKEEMLAIPGLDAAMVDAIIAARPILDMLTVDRILAPKLTEEQRKAVYEKLWTQMNLNTVSREEILLMPGSGPRIVREFQEYKPYAALAVFQREMGKYFDDAEVARLSRYVFVPINLNTATDEDILTIPGVDARMLREFKEYRPYDNIEKFRREMGKYVDAAQVARLERYVTIGK